VIPQLAPGQYFLEADMPGSRNGESAPFTVPDPARLRRKGDAPTTPPTLVLDDWSLDEGMQATVSVLDAAGAAIAGAEVSAIEIDAASAPAIAAVRTGTDGRATLTRLDPALALKVGCSAPGYLRSDQTFERVPRDVRCTLARLSSLAGRLVDSDDKPIGGATLTVGRSQHSAESGRSGSFAFAKLPPGRYRLTAAAPGFSALSRNIVVAAGERLDLGTLRLAPADRLFGKVVDAVSGDPVVDAAVAVVEPLGGGSTTTDGQGAFSLAVGSDSDLGLEVRATDFPVKRIVVGSDIRSTENEPLVIRISRGGRIQVTVWEEGADTPCLGCSVVLSGGESKTTALVTDTSGKATSELLEPGEWQAYLETVESIGSVVRVHGGDAIRLTTVEAGAVSHVDLGRHATLRVVFASPLPAGWSLAAEASSLHSNVPASADGSFAVRRPSGESVALSLFDGSLREVRMAVVPADYSDPVLTLPLPATSLRGALMSGKAPLQERAVSLVGAVGGSGVASAVTDDRGAFEIPFAPPGVYSLAVDGKPAQVVEVRERRPVDLGVLQLPE
jgi:hypothetical protein